LYILYQRQNLSAADPHEIVQAYLKRPVGPANPTKQGFLIWHLSIKENLWLSLQGNGAETPCLNTKHSFDFLGREANDIGTFGTTRSSELAVVDAIWTTRGGEKIGSILDSKRDCL
jgi:hypothetical protein